MKRTTIMLPEELRQRALRRARQKGVSLGCLIRDALTQELARPGAETSFLLRDVVYSGRVPRDASDRHDEIYDEEHP